MATRYLHRPIVEQADPVVGRSARYLHRPTVFEEPDLIVGRSAWNGLIPFAFWIIDALRPRIFVELGTETGVSYCAFCQAVQTLRLPACGFAVDTWEGDAHTGPYDEEVFRTLMSYHDPRYGSFSRLIRRTFDEAVEHFSDGSIDLLHIDGYHTYEAVSHDFYTWLPKLSSRGVVLFHDTNVREMDFGVWRLWEELWSQFPSFSLIHSHGLGVLAVGNDVSQAVRWLTKNRSGDSQETYEIRTFFARLGESILARIEKNQLSSRAEQELARLSGQLDPLKNQLSEREREVSTLQAGFAERGEQLEDLHSQLNLLQARLGERELQVGALQAELGGRNIRITALQQELGAANDRFARVSAEMERLRAQVADLQAELSEQKERTSELLGQLGTLQEQQAVRDANVARLTDEVETLRGQLLDRDSQLARLAAETTGLRNQLADRAAEVAKLTDDAQTLATQLVARDSQQARLTAEGEKLRSQLADRDAKVSRLTDECKTRDVEVARLLDEVETLGRRLAARDSEQARLTAEGESLRKQLAERERQLAGLWNSNSWRLTKPLRAIRRALLGAPKRLNSSSDNSGKPDEARSLRGGVFYSFDWLRIKRGRLYGYGWVFHKELRIAGVKLLAESKEKEHVVRGYYGAYREDVARGHPFPNARGCGFWVAGTLPFEEPSSFFLQVEFENCEVVLLPVQHAKKQWSVENPDGNQPDPAPTIGGILVTPRRVAAGVRALLRGESGKIVHTFRAEVGKQRELQWRFSFEDLLGSMGELSQRSSPAENGSRNINFSAEVQAFLDAAKDSRLSGRKFVLLIDHNLGGGANKYRQSLIETILKKNHPVLLLYYDLPQLHYIIAHISLDSDVRFRMNSPASLIEMAGKIGIEEIILNNVYSFEDPLAMPALLPSLKEALAARLTVAIHDYLPVCPSYTLLDETGKFCGIPDLLRCEQCLPNNKGEFSLLVEHRDIKAWRKVWGDCLRQANTILCFSESSVRLLRRAYPDLDPARLTVRPHMVDYLPQRRPVIDHDADLNIGVVGAISVQKGSGVVADLAACVQRRGVRARITVLGTIAGVPASSVVTITGTYERNDLPDLIEKHGINMFLFPSICPETFSYVVEELMQLDVPLAVFNLGAPPERVAGYSKGLILPEIDADKTLDALLAFRNRLRGQVRNDPTSGSLEGKQTEEKRTGRNSSPAGNVHAFTSAAINYLPKVRLLRQSLKQYHPEITFHWILPDKVPDWLHDASELCDNLIPIESLEIPNRTGWIFQHTITELCTAVKAFALRQLLNQEDCKQVFYFDPDVVLFSPIDELIEKLNEHNLILTPHQTQPETDVEAVADNEICSLRHGIYNLGFLGVRNTEESRRFADWWCDRLYYFCRNAPDMHLFTDQKWFNHVPVFFEGVGVIKSPRFNVATWNITRRKLQGSFEQGFTVDREPLGFYHFTGFDSGAHKIMATKYAAGNPAVESLVCWYSEAVQNSRDASIRNARWAFGAFENGEPITLTHRLIYRMRKDLQEAFPDPFEVKPGKKSYYQWFGWRARLEHALFFSQGGRAVAWPSSNGESHDAAISPNGNHRVLTKYELREPIAALGYTRAGLLVHLAQLLLLTKHYLTWGSFHFKQGGLGTVLQRGKRRIQLMLGLDGAGSAVEAPAPAPANPPTLLKEENHT